VSTKHTHIKALLTGSLICFLLLWSASIQAGDTITFTSHYQSVLNDQMPVLRSGNASAWKMIPKLDLGLASAGYTQQRGGLKRSMEGTSYHQRELHIQQYHYLKKTLVYGEFNYSNSTETDVNYFTVNDPYRNTPYFYGDTLTGGRYKRESFHLKGIIAVPLSQQWDFGLASSYSMALSYQDYDPRANNTVSRFSLSPGVTFCPGNWKIGTHLAYSYYNEDITIKVIEANSTARFYSLSGLGHYNEFFDAAGTYRLYQRHTGTMGIQIQNRYHLLELSSEVFKEQIKDGRGA